MLTEDRIQSLIPQIIEFARTNPDGFTLDLRSRREFDRNYGYVVAVHNENTDNIPATLALAKKHNLALIGGWWDAEAERYEFDACAWFEDCSEAVAFGKSQGEKAIFDCGEQLVIRLEVSDAD